MKRLQLFLWNLSLFLIMAHSNLPMEDISELQRLIILGDSMRVIACLRAGADPNYRAKDGKTPLFMALYPDISFRGHAFGATEAFQNTQTLVPLLLSCDADPHVQDYRGQTLMKFAYTIGNFGGVRLLESHCDLCKYSSLEQQRLWDEHRNMLRDLAEKLKNPPPCLSGLELGKALFEDIDFRLLEGCE